MDNKNIFATNLKKHMALNGKSRKDISEALGISYYTVTDWVKGKKYPRMDKVEMLAQYFGVLKSDLIEEKNPPVSRRGTPGEEMQPISENTQKLVDFVKTVPEDKAEYLLRVMKSILE